MSRQLIRPSLQSRAQTLFSRFMFGVGLEKQMLKLMASGASYQSGGFGDYTPTANDVIVATLFRSGTNWMLQTALQIAHRGTAEYDYMFDVIPWPEFVLQAAIKLDEPVPPSPTGLRVIKTHLEAPHVPFNSEARYITVIRDPKDHLVSTYYFAPQTLSYYGLKVHSPDYWLDLFFTDYFPFGRWAEHTAGWWAKRDEPNTFVLTFNQLKAQSEYYVDQIAAWMGVELTPEERANVLEKSSFSYMKSINHKLAPTIPNQAPIDIVRSGKTGSSHDLFSEAQRARIDAYCQEKLRELGSDFPYADAFL